MDQVEKKLLRPRFADALKAAVDAAECRTIMTFGTYQEINTWCDTVGIPLIRSSEDAWVVYPLNMSTVDIEVTYQEFKFKMTQFRELKWR